MLHELLSLLMIISRWCFLSTVCSTYNKAVIIQGVRKTENWFGFSFTKTELSKNSVQTVFRKILSAVCSSN